MDAAGCSQCICEIGYFVHRKCTPSWEIAADVISFTDLTYVLAGSAWYTIGTERYKASAGDLLCIPRGTFRMATADPNDLMEGYALNVNLVGLPGVPQSLPFPLISHIGRQPDVVALYRDLGAEWLRRVPGYEMKVQAYLLLILQRYYELLVYRSDSGQVDSRVKQALRYIAEHYTEPLSISTMAGVVGLNPVYFGSLFKASTGLSFRQYLTHIRLNHAEDMLRSGEYNICETALLCGYNDSLYFSKVFKENRGFSPSKISRPR